MSVLFAQHEAQTISTTETHKICSGEEGGAANAESNSAPDTFQEHPPVNALARTCHLPGEVEDFGFIMLRDRKNRMQLVMLVFVVVDREIGSRFVHNTRILIWNGVSQSRLHHRFCKVSFIVKSSLEAASWQHDPGMPRPVGRTPFSGR